MNINSNRYTFIFALIICVLCGVMLSAITEGLRPQQQLNEELDGKKNILKAVVLKNPLTETATAKDILQAYAEKINEIVIDDKGAIVEGKKPKQITEKETNLYPLYIYHEGDSTISYAFPIYGQGLWSTIYGYMAIEADAITVRGVTFYKHGETPGLGGEVEKEWYQNNFKGKKIFDVTSKQLTPVMVVKGKVSEVLRSDAKAQEHAVDGITAATLTGNGVTAFLDKWIRTYDKYLSKVRKI